MKRTPLYMALAGLALSAAAISTYAQEQVLEEVIVTGSYIPGTPEDAAVPVDVYDSEEMSKLGSPDMLDFIKTIPASSGVLGSSNQFDGKSQGSDGAGSINLRGLGQQRTLVLLNGKRLATNPFTGAVDTNLLPLAAMGRLELLKDGAAVLYGSDAVAGVVNFITKKDFEGFEIGYDHNFVQDSNGDDTIRANWGWVGDNSNVLVSAGYQKKGKLSVADRDWGMLPIEANPQGGWSGGGNPSGFLSLALGAGNTEGHFQDPGCAALGGTQLLSSATVPRCRFEYTPFDNLVDPLERYQVFSQYNVELGNGMEFSLEGLVAHTETDYHTSPSYLATQRSSYSSVFIVPGTHPGLADLASQFPVSVVRNDGAGNLGTADTSTLVGSGVAQALLTFRPYAMGGNPLYGYGAARSAREYDQYRVSADLSGSFGSGIDWQTSVTFSEVTAFRSSTDTIVDRYQAALFGLGGPNCTNPADAGNSAAGCLTYSPFSTSVRFNALTGDANPNFVNAYDNENPELISWMFPTHWLEDTSSNLTVDAVLNGGMGVELSGGEVMWAAGLQYRSNTYERALSGLNNLELYPCPAAVDSWTRVIAPGAPAGPFTGNCADYGQQDGTGPFFFLGGAYEADLDGDVMAAFAEFQLPITDTLEAQVAVRYEDYGGLTGDTFDPKVAMRWQATDEFAVRGSYSSTFRAPPINSLTDSSATSLQNINNTFRPIDNFGDPALQPEEADAFNFGVIYSGGAVYASLDYWAFDFDNPLTVDPLNPMVAALFGTTGNANCGNPAYAALEARFTFSGACDIANVARVRTNTVNGSARTTDGIDWKLTYTWDLASGNAIEVGTQGTYTLSYEFEDVFVEGILVEEGRDAVGYLNAQTSAWPLPDIKGDIYGQYTAGAANFRLTASYLTDYEDQRFAQAIDDITTFNFHYRYLWTTDVAETVINLSVENITDEDPPFARLDLDYDSFTHSALGRTIKVGFTTNF